MTHRENHEENQIHHKQSQQKQRTTKAKKLKFMIPLFNIVKPEEKNNLSTLKMLQAEKNPKDTN